MIFVRYLMLLLAAALPLGALAAVPAEDLELYQTHCARCHGAERLGVMGPALLPENLGRLRKPAAAEVIAKGRAATQMPAFGETLDKAQIERLVELIYTPPSAPPVWDRDDIRASHIIHYTPESLRDTPIFTTPDVLNLFIVVELGDHHATLLDGTTLTPIHRFPTRFALHGGPKFSPAKCPNLPVHQ